MSKLDELRGLAGAATPGPWYPSGPENAYGNPASLASPARDPSDSDEHDNRQELWTVATSPTGAGWNTDGGYPGYGITERDAAFIAACDPQTITLLLDCLEAAKALRVCGSDENYRAFDAALAKLGSGSHAVPEAIVYRPDNAWTPSGGAEFDLKPGTTILMNMPPSVLDRKGKD